MSLTNNFNVGGRIVSAVASETMAERFVVVQLHSVEGQVSLPTNTNILPFGVIQQTAVSGQAVPVQIDGITQVVAGGAVALGALVYLQATTGRVDDSDTGTCVGLSLSATAADGELLIVDLSYKGAA